MNRRGTWGIYGGRMGEENVLEIFGLTPPTLKVFEIFGFAPLNLPLNHAISMRI